MPNVCIKVLPRMAILLLSSLQSHLAAGREFLIAHGVLVVAY